MKQDHSTGLSSYLVDLVYLLCNLTDQPEVVRHQHLRYKWIPHVKRRPCTA